VPAQRELSVRLARLVQERLAQREQVLQVPQVLVQPELPACSAQKLRAPALLERAAFSPPVLRRQQPRPAQPPS